MLERRDTLGLLKALGHGDAKVRQSAAEALGQTAGETPLAGGRVVVGECEACHRPLRVKAHAVRSEMHLARTCGHVNIVHMPEELLPEREGQEVVTPQPDPVLAYVEALALVSQRMATSSGSGFLGAGREECRQIGREINARWGFDGMVRV